MGEIKLDGTEGSINALAEDLSLQHRIRQNNDEEKVFDTPEPVCCGYQFEDGVRFMCISTVHILCNMARAKNYGWQ